MGDITGEGYFDDGSNKPSGAATPLTGVEVAELGAKKKRKVGGGGKKAKTTKQRLAMADGDIDMG